MSDQHNLEDLLEAHAERKVIVDPLSTFLAIGRGLAFGLTSFIAPFSSFRKTGEYQEEVNALIYAIYDDTKRLNTEFPGWDKHVAADNRIKDIQAQHYLLSNERLFFRAGAAVSFLTGITAMTYCGDILDPATVYDGSTQAAAGMCLRAYSAFFCTDAVYNAIKTWIWPDSKKTPSTPSRDV